ncbi:hypothetical protein [Herbaspirillum sp. YR522]|uniref:hypothetical protein n=1 Tax=Herbaspirillum sp. YR522 TaxID=1144342 RepID=UPI00026FA247|nr:hypothetical protein [Herbaspirillum sp. YR522]EJN08894.1 hypothetical protein PMI40_01027 [Herbaspirillum sp. YR522]
MNDLPRLDDEQLRQLAQQSAAITQACNCVSVDASGWTSLPLSLPEQQLQDIGTLLQDPYIEPTFAEYHPEATRYASPQAPVAPRHFPYNRCNLARCTRCARVYLRYTEAGGYFVDRRIRALNAPALIHDPT